MSSNQPRSPLARSALAAGGIAVLIGLAKLEEVIADTIGGARGLSAAALLALTVFAACALAAAWHQWRPGLTRPGPVRLPGRSRDDLEPANSLS